MLDVIAEELRRFREQHGRGPDTLYLGNKEWRDLYHDTESIGRIYRTTDNGKSRDTILGLRIYRVAEDSHLRIV